MALKASQELQEGPLKVPSPRFTGNSSAQAMPRQPSGKQTVHPAITVITAKMCQNVSR